MSGPDRSDDDFLKRRDRARQAVNAMDRNVLHDEPERQRFFNAVYERAAGDPAFVPWADLAPKPQLVQWLERNPGITSTGTSSAIDIACGLGDNAEAIAAAGYRTIAFDLSPDAVRWARERFPASPVDYRVADLFALPAEWSEAFDLVNECYTLQALPPEMVGRTAGAIASLVRPGGTLLVYARVRPDGAEASGPPWPLEETSLMVFSRLGFDLVSDKRFVLSRRDRDIADAFCVWQKA